MTAGTGGHPLSRDPGESLFPALFTVAAGPAGFGLTGLPRAFDRLLRLTGTHDPVGDFANFRTFVMTAFRSGFLFHMSAMYQNRVTVPRN